MRTVVLGATGFIGRALVLGLQGRAHDICVLARSPAKAHTILPAGVEVVDFNDDAATRDAIAKADAVVNLAGESIAGKRWTKRRKQLLVTSRIAVTERLVDAIAARERPLPVFVSASAIGYYGDRGDAELDDHSTPGEGFAASLCRTWEAAARHAEATRVVTTRFGIVLGRDGGALEPLLRIARLGLGGPLGEGNQWVSWIHLEDLVMAVIRAIEDPRIDGPLAVVAPHPVRQRELASTLGALLHRPARLPAPKFALSLALGEASELLLASQRVIPRALLAAGFRHRFRSLDAALADLLDDGASVDRTRSEELPDAAYLKERHPRYTLHAETELDAPIADVFAFFSSPANLGAITPAALAFEICGHSGEIDRSTVIDYKIRIAGVPMRWRTRIERWQPGEMFVDSQERGPYRAWWHEHRFFERDGKTIMQDIVHYAPPLGPLGAIANRLFIERMLRRIFGFRRTAIRLRFAGRPAVSSRAFA
jgi:uncharacterized protein (TIGR01777 family)